MKTELSDEEKRIIKAIKKLGDKASNKRIAEEAKMSAPTASKYLSVLEGKEIIKKDKSQPPYVFWKIIDVEVL